MKKLLLATALLFTLANFAQLPTFDWARTFGDYQSEPSSVAVDSNGNVFTAGIFKNTGDFDSGSNTFNLTASGEKEFYVTKYDATGNFIWAKSFGAIAGSSSNTNDDTYIKLTLDSQGNVLLSGTFYGIGDFDPGIGTAMVTSTTFGASYYAGNFILKLDFNGNFVWVKKISAFLNCTSNAIVVDADNEIYVVGNFSFSADLDPGPGNYPVNAVGNSDIYMVKLNANGDFVWGKTIANNNGEQINKNLKVDVNKNVFVSGSYRNTLDLDPGVSIYNVTSNGEKDFFILKLDSSGNFVWGKSIGGTDNDNATDMSLDAVGNLYVVGTFLFTVDFDPGAGSYPLKTTNSPFNNYILKLDTNGNFNWARNLSDAPKPPTVANDSAGNVYVFSGFYSLFGTFDADPGTGVFPLTTSPDNDVYFVKLDPDANFLGAFNYGDGRFRSVIDMVVDNTNKIYYCGYFSQTGSTILVDLNPFEGVNDFSSTTSSFVVKLAQPTLNTSINLKSSFYIYPNPTAEDLNIVTTLSLSNATLKIISITGQTVFEKQNLSGTDFNFDVSNLSQGLYIVQLTNGNEVFNSKFIKH